MNQRLMRIVTGVLLTVVFTVIYFLLSPSILTAIFALMGIAIIELELRKLKMFLLAPLYPTPSILLLCKLNQTAEYHHLVLILFATTFAFDTGAYIVGTSLGKTPIAPTVSPKKTWEGLIGGYLLCYAVTILCAWYYTLALTPCMLTLLSIGITFAAFFGDLFVSLLKRRVHLKDTGSLLPGHGGLLDRFDSVLFVVVLIYLLRNKLLIP